MTGRMIIRKILDSLNRTESLYHGLRVSPGESRPFLDRVRRVEYTTKFDSGRGRGLRGVLVAETDISTESAPPSQDARLPRADENQGRPQGPCGAPQKGTSSPYTHLVRRRTRVTARERRRGFRARCGCCGAWNTRL